MSTIQTIIIAIVEGLTEFLPISSTGHMIITEKILNLTENDFSKVFTVAIQLGAILAVVVLYWKKFFDFTCIHSSLAAEKAETRAAGSVYFCGKLETRPSGSASTFAAAFRPPRHTNTPAATARLNSRNNFIM